jgi:purine catabolism regulator
VLGGDEHLDKPVRWVHVSEMLDLTGLLSGGELVLTTALELDKQLDRTPSYVRSLVSMGAAGLIVELVGERGPTAAALRRAANDTDFPVILVERRVRFVEITEVVHRKIVAEQLDRVERTRDVHEAFTQLSLESAGTQQVVEQAATMIGASVVLEDLAHYVLAYSVRNMETTDLLEDWNRRSRTSPSSPQTARTGPESWLQTPVGVTQRLWGRLVVPAPLGDDDMAGMVLERAAQTLAINRLADRDRRELSQQAQTGLLGALRRPNGLSEGEALARAGALGLKRTPFYLPVVLRTATAAEGPMGGTVGNDRGTTASGLGHDRLSGVVDPLAGQQAERELLDVLARALKSTAISALVASIQSGTVGMILALQAEHVEEQVLQRLAHAVGNGLAEPSQDAGAAVGHSIAGPAQWTIGVGRQTDTLLRAAGGIDEAAHVAETAATLGQSGKPFYRATDIRLRGLLALLRHDPRAQQFAESELAGILEAEAQGKRGLLDLLSHYLEAGGNKAAIARSGYLSRPTLYARLAALEDVLSVDLEDPESRTSLHVALLLHRLRGL